MKRFANVATYSVLSGLLVAILVMPAFRVPVAKVSALIAAQVAGS